MTCIKIKPDGKSCQAHSLQGGQYCFRHNKNTQGKALQASSKGGKAKKSYLTLGKLRSIKTPKDIQTLMASAINKLWTGQMPASNPAGALGYLAKIFLEAYEKSELEARIEVLEKRINEEKK